VISLELKIFRVGVSAGRVANWALFDQGLVCEISVGDDDHRSNSHLKCENWAVDVSHLIDVFEKLFTGAREL